MSEILEKFLIISFGLTMLIIILTYMSPYMTVIENLTLNSDEDLYLIKSDMNELIENINKFKNDEPNTNLTKKFVFQGQISLIIDNYQENHTNCIFRFYNNRTTYRNIQISIIFQIEIQSIFIKQYTIGEFNNSKFINFY